MKKIFLVMAMALFFSCSENGNEEQEPQEPEKEIESIELDSHQLQLTVGEEIVLDYDITPVELSSEKVVWGTSNSAIATVTSNGKVKAVGVGDAVISVVTDNGETDQCQVSVSPILVKGITLDKTSVDLLPEGEITLTAEAKPDNAENKNIVWASSNESIATVDQQGNVVGVGRGTAEISTTNEASGMKAVCIVNVKNIEDFMYLEFGYAGCVITNYMVTGRLYSLFKNDSPEPVEVVSISWSPPNMEVSNTYGEFGVFQPGDGLNVQFSCLYANRPTVYWFFNWRGRQHMVTHTIDLRNYPR